MLSPPELSEPYAGLEDLDYLTRLAEDAVARGRTDDFYAALRRSEIPYLLSHHAGDLRELVLASLAALHALGTASPAIALGVSQHMATMLAFGLSGRLLEEHETAGPVIGALLQETLAQRLLIANTTSQGGGNRIGTKGSQISPEGEGFRIDGHSTFMSLATEAEKIVFLTYAAGGALVGVVTDADTPGLEVSGELLFGDHLALADTRRVFFDGLHVEADAVFGPDPALNAFYALQLVCHNLCVSALYLGGGRRIVEEVRRHGRTSMLPSGAPLATSDSFGANVGGLVITYLNAVDLLLSQVHLVSTLTGGDALDPATAGAALLRVSTAKHGVARSAETVATEGRKLIGARAFMGDHPVGRIGAEIAFAALGPATEKLIERNVGLKFLAEGT
ncbi:hypothetical protein [Nocardioides zeae]|uniref:Acyl-CoA dehydrogenase n=1 Tax=Nocardioides zeae TaxID=1457234 RepID=A0A6P0HLJ5_9ACTN|nr:hypothetical protein [Nocardioides zeae]NEN79552.1 hypothetical protein [Nocardioides zeae]